MSTSRDMQESVWDGSSKANKSGYRIFIFILKRWGVAPAYFLLYFVAGYYFLFSKKSNRAIRYYLKDRMGFPVNTISTKLYKNYYWFGQAIIDRIVLMAGIHNQFTFNFDGEKYLHEMVAGGKGGLLLSAHAGNWEIAGYLLYRVKANINIVIFDGEHQAIKEYLDQETGQHHAKFIIIKQDLSHIYAITEALNKNELVCMHADRFLPGNKTIRARFLNVEAPFPLGPFALAAKLAVPVSFVFAMKETRRHYHFYASRPVEYKKDSQSPATILSDFIAQLEARLRQYPEQWYNYYNFWNLV